MYMDTHKYRPRWLSGKESTCQAESACLIDLWVGKIPGEGNGNPLQYSCLENRMDGGVWQATVHGVAKIGHNLATKPPPPPSSRARQ